MAGPVPLRAAECEGPLGVKTEAYVRVFVKQLLSLLCAPQGTKAGRFEIMGLVAGVDERQRYKSFRIEDGSGAIECRSWSTGRSPHEGSSRFIEKPLRLGDTALLRGVVSSSQQFVLDSFCIYSVGSPSFALIDLVPIDSPAQECFWIQQTLFIQKHVYPAMCKLNPGSSEEAPSPLSEQPASKEHRDGDWLSALQMAPNTFKASDLPRLSLAEGDIEMLKERGLVCFYRFENCYHKYSSEGLRLYIERLLKRSAVPVHYCLVWKYLQSCGFDVSRKLVLKALIHQCAEKSPSIRQVSLKEFQFIC